jgi:glutamine cyclotransferase
MSDGTDQIRFLNPETLAETGRIRVTFRGQPVSSINELEWVKGEIYANIWQTDVIVRINPKTGQVVGRIALRGLPLAQDRNGSEDVVNGIAYDAKGDRLLVTGKQWSKIYEIKLNPVG